MAVFITQGRYTDKAMTGMVDNPDDRAVAVAALMEAAGGKMLHYFVTFGEYDFMVISEGDSAEDIMAGLMVAGATGGVTNLKTTLTVTTAEAKSAMTKANAIRAKFRAAGSAG